MNTLSIVGARIARDLHHIGRNAASYGVVLLLSFGVHADYQTGLDAYSFGDYAMAMAEWREVTDGPPTAVSPGIFVEAHYAVAMLYFTGRGVAQDYGQARHWLERAASMNHAAAQAKLGFLYTDGMGVAQDYRQAFQWFSKAAAGGNVNGLYNLGMFYLYGWGVEPDAARAEQYLAAAAARGDPAAQAALRDLPAAPVADEAVAAESEAVAVESEGAVVAAEAAPAEAEAIAIAAEAAPTGDEETIPVTAQAVPAETAQPLSGIHDEAWILAQNPQHYTIQVMALRTRESVEELARDYAEFAPFAIYTVPQNSRPLYVLVQGDYADVESARLAKAGFPRRLQRQDALWIRRFEMVQALLDD